MWKIIFGFSLAGAIAFLLSAALLASTIRSLDVSVHDRYVAIFPSHLLLLSAALIECPIMLLNSASKLLSLTRLTHKWWSPYDVSLEFSTAGRSSNW